MAIVVILVLGILWAAVLLPPMLRARAEGGGRSGALGGAAGFVSSAFGRARSADPDLPAMQPLMGPVGPVARMAPLHSPGMNAAQKRRRDVLIGLLVAVGITLVMALFTGGSIMFLGLNVLADALLVGYVFLLLQLKSRHQGRRPGARSSEPAGRHLRAVPGTSEPAPAHEPALLLRRTATY